MNSAGTTRPFPASYKREREFSLLAVSALRILNALTNALLLLLLLLQDALLDVDIILQPLTDKSRCKLQSTENFIDAIKTVQIPDDYKLVSFDVKSLFTSIPLQLALNCN